MLQHMAPSARPISPAAMKDIARTDRIAYDVAAKLMPGNRENNRDHIANQENGGSRLLSNLKNDCRLKSSQEDERGRIGNLENRSSRRNQGNSYSHLGNRENEGGFTSGRQENGQGIVAGRGQEWSCKDGQEMEHVVKQEPFGDHVTKSSQENFPGRAHGQPFGFTPSAMTGAVDTSFSSHSR